MNSNTDKQLKKLANGESITSKQAQVLVKSGLADIEDGEIFLTTKGHNRLDAISDVVDRLGEQAIESPEQLIAGAAGALISGLIGMYLRDR